MAYGLGMIWAPACQNRVGNVLTLFALRQRDPQTPFTHCPPAGTPPGLVFGAPRLSGMLRGSRQVGGTLVCCFSGPGCVQGLGAGNIPASERG